MTLTEFLLARIAEDETVARAAGASTDGEPSTLRTSLKEACRTGGDPHGPRGTVETTPTRVLAECEAKRRIVQMSTDLDASCKFDGPPSPDWMTGDTPDGWGAAMGTVEQALTLLALPYADHPDYDETWRP
jgi:hypothetical protein